MIVVGVDPGARQTGVVAAITLPVGPAELLARATVNRVKTEPLLEVSPEYLLTLHGVIAEMVSETGATVLAVEGVTRPRQHLNGARARGGNGGAAADPTAIMATALVLGSILGRRWGSVGHECEVVVVPPGRNGNSALPYPAPIAAPPGGRGMDARRHERSAFDVARSAPAWVRLARQSGRAYAG